MHSVQVWKNANSPNYTTNDNKLYPYSEVPFIGEYKLVRLSQQLKAPIELVDYWGEGRIVEVAGTSGFPDSYNVNHQHQLVSNGPDRERKIPNRIPVVSYTDCDTSAYIEDNSVQTVTLMGAPIHQTCANDISRIINVTSGRVIIFNFDENSQDVKHLDEALKGKEILPCSGFELSDKMKELTLFGSHRAYLNITELEQELNNKIEKGRYEEAMNISDVLYRNNNGLIISKTVTKLIKDKSTNIMKYGHKLWDNENTLDILRNYFPLSFALIFRGHAVKIISKRFMQALKLDASVDSYGDRLAWGDSRDMSSERVLWEFIPVFIEDNVYFNIKNCEHNIYLKLDASVDSYGDRKAWGADYSREARFLWSLQPVKVGDDLLFLIKNKDYGQGLKLDINVDSYGDRILWGNAGSVDNDPLYYGWYIAPNV